MKRLEDLVFRLGEAVEVALIRYRHREWLKAVDCKPGRHRPERRPDGVLHCADCWRKLKR